MSSDREMAQQRAVVEAMERRARADAYIFRRAAWVWGVFCLSGSIAFGSGILKARPAAWVGHLDSVALGVLAVAGGLALAFLLPACLTAMQVGKVVWRRWWDSR